MKDYMFHLKDFLSFVFEGDKNFSEDELLDLIEQTDKKDVEDYLHHL